ncbi:fatty acyl-AMP ligase [Glaciimonas sp. GG7]
MSAQIGQYSDAEGMQTFVDSCLRHIRTNGDKPALIMLADRCREDLRISYTAFGQKVMAIAARLQQQYKVGQRVLLVYTSNSDFMMGFMACQFAGLVAVPVPAPTKMGAHFQRIEHIARDAEVALVMTNSSLFDEVSKWLHQSPLSDVACLASDTVTLSEANHWKKPCITPSSLSFLQYTSGSTGDPKGVMINHRNLVHNSTLIYRKFNHSAETIFGGWLPFYHDMGLIGLMLQALFAGGTFVYLTPLTFMKRPGNWLNAISIYGINTTGGPNFGFDHCTRRIDDKEIEGIDLSSLKLCFNGAEPVRLETMDKFAERFAPCGFNKKAFYPCYGMAETTLFVSGVDAGGGYHGLTVDAQHLEMGRAVVSIDATEDATRQLVSCGSAHDLKLIVVDPETRKQQLDNRVGEIWVAGTSVADGYWRQPEKTAESFHARLATKSAGLTDELMAISGPGYLRTGDLGFLRDNALFVTGRMKDLIIINGRNIYPQDIESRVIQNDPGKYISAAFAIHGADGEAVAIVHEVAVDEKDALVLHATALRNDIAAHFEVSVALVVLVKRGAIPRTTSGKIQRKKTQMLWEQKQLVPLYESHLRR